MNILPDLLVIALLFLLLWNARIAGRDEFFEDYLSRERTCMIKGALSLVVMFHHMAQKTSTGWIFQSFTRFGGLVVTMFFFYSGYGLMKSYLVNPDYQKSFLRRRIPVVAVPYLIANVIYWLAYCCLGFRLSIRMLLHNLSCGGLLVQYSWYAVVILLFYLAFYILMFLGKRKTAIIIGAAVFLAAWDSLCIRRVFPEYWYGTSHILLVGMLWASCEKRILEFIKRRYITVVVVSAAAFCAAFVLSRPLPGKIGLAVRGVMYIVFAVLVLTIQLKASLGNRWLRFLGGISFEIYLYQGIFISFGLLSRLKEINEALWAAAVIGGTVALAWVCRLASGWILSRLCTDRKS